MIPSLKTPKKMSYRHAFSPIWWKQFLIEVLWSQVILTCVELTNITQYKKWNVQS